MSQLPVSRNLALAMVMIVAAQASAQFRTTSRPQDLLRREDVKKELGLLENQIKDLDEFRRDQYRRSMERMRDFRNMSREERSTKMREAFASAGKETEEKLKKLLLPHQYSRLKQIAVQAQMQGSTSRALTSNEISTELKIDDKQKDQIRKKAEELSKEMAEKMAALRKEMSEKILAELTPSQRAKWKRMVGEPFEFQRTNRTTRGRTTGRTQRPSR